MGYLPIIMLTQYARYGVLPTQQHLYGPDAGHEGGR